MIQPPDPILYSFRGFGPKPDLQFWSREGGKLPFASDRLEPPRKPVLGIETFYSLESDHALATLKLWKGAYDLPWKRDVLATAFSERIAPPLGI